MAEKNDSSRQEHQSVGSEKHRAESESSQDLPSLPHKRYRAQPHHSILLETDTSNTEPVLSTSQYLPDFLKSTPALSIIPEEERGSIHRLIVQSDYIFMTTV